MVDLAKSIQDLGLAGIIVLMVLVLVFGGARQLWVWGWTYRQERETRIVAETQAVRNAESIATSNESYAELAKAFTELSKAFAEQSKSSRTIANDVARLLRAVRPPADDPR